MSIVHRLADNTGKLTVGMMMVGVFRGHCSTSSFTLMPAASGYIVCSLSSRIANSLHLVLRACQSETDSDLVNGSGANKR